jgi:hypothetical protein
VVAEVINVDEPEMKIAAVNWIVRGRVQSSEPPQSTFRLKAPPPPRPLKTMPYVSVETAKLLLSGLKALRKDNAGKDSDRPSKSLKSLKRTSEVATRPNHLRRISVERRSMKWNPSSKRCLLMTK